MREIEKYTIISVLNECLRDFPHIGARRKEQKTCLVNLARGKMFLESCRPASVLPDNKVAITEQLQEGVIFALQSRLHYLRISVQKQACVLKKSLLKEQS